LGPNYTAMLATGIALEPSRRPIGGQVRSRWWLPAGGVLALAGVAGFVGILIWGSMAGLLRDEPAALPPLFFAATAIFGVSFVAGVWIVRQFLWERARR
jgi:hypothetical protein